MPSYHIYKGYDLVYAAKVWVLNKGQSFPKGVIVIPGCIQTISIGILDRWKVSVILFIIIIILSLFAFYIIHAKIDILQISYSISD